jgi:hypothetical protein
LSTDAPPDGLALALAGLALTVAAGPFLEQQSHAAVGDDALLHREALLVVAAGDPKDVALVLVAEVGAVDLGGHAQVVQRPQLALILDLDADLAARGRVGDVELEGRGRRDGAGGKAGERG